MSDEQRLKFRLSLLFIFSVACFVSASICRCFDREELTAECLSEGQLTKFECKALVRQMTR